MGHPWPCDMYREGRRAQMGPSPPYAVSDEPTKRYDLSKTLCDGCHSYPPDGVEGKATILPLGPHRRGDQRVTTVNPPLMDIWTHVWAHRWGKEPSSTKE